MLVSLIKKIGLKFSLNDPGWGRGSNDNDPNRRPDGKRPNEGPPDLDQLWRDFNQRINRMFGNRGGGGGGSGRPGGGMTDMRGAGIGVAVLAAIVFFLWLVSGFFIVQEGQTGVVLTFGKYDNSTAPPGFNWRWPYPIQSHEIVNVSQVRTVEVGYRTSSKNKQPKESLMLTDDENIIDIQFAVQYKLKNAAEWIFNNREQEETVKQVAEAAIREVVGKSKMDFVLYEGRDKVVLDVAKLMQQILDIYKIGVQIANVTMLGVQPPEQVQAAFDDAVKAGQDRERQKNEGQAYANEVIPKASGAASRLMQESNGYRERVIANAQGEASRFKQVLTEYQKAPAVMRDRLYLDVMQQIFSSTTKVMIDTRSNNSLMYLPLDKLIAQTGAGDAGSARNAQAPLLSAPPESPPSSELQGQRDARSRDSRDTRDREAR